MLVCVVMYVFDDLVVEWLLVVWVDEIGVFVCCFDSMCVEICI